MSLLDRLEVPEARSRASTRATRRPRDAASSAAPAPVMPPPMTSTSNRSAASRLSVASRSRASRTPLLATAFPHQALPHQPLPHQAGPPYRIVPYSPHLKSMYIVNLAVNLDATVNRCFPRDDGLAQNRYVRTGLPLAEALPGVVVDFEGSLRRPFGLRDVPEVEADPVPDGAAAAHRVDQHVRRLEQRPHSRIARLPALQARHRLVLAGRPGDLDQRHRAAPPTAGSAGLPRRRRGRPSRGSRASRGSPASRCGLAR